MRLKNLFYEISAHLRFPSSLLFRQHPYSERIFNIFMLVFLKAKVVSRCLKKFPTSTSALLNSKKIVGDSVFKIQVLQMSHKWTFPYKIVQLQIECFSRAAIECRRPLLFPSRLATARTRATAHKSLSNYRAAVGPRRSSSAIAVRR